MERDRLVIVAVIAAAVLFIGFKEFSGGVFTGAAISRNAGWVNCIDTDPENDPAVIGEVSVERWNPNTKRFEEQEAKVDECAGNSAQEDWYCLPYDKPTSRNVHCGSGKECRAGACVTKYYN